MPGLADIEAGAPGTLEGPAASPFLLIYGAPRSGTYLLAAEMQAAFDIAIPIETQFIPVFACHLWAFGDLSRPASRARLFDAVMRYTEMLVSGGYRLANAEAQRPFSLLAVRDARAQVIASSCDYATLVSAMFGAYAAVKGKRTFADKSAFYDPYGLGEYADLLGRVRVVNIVRDGRDVAASWMATWFGPADIEMAALLWRRYVELAEAFAAKRPDCVLTLRYEDLVADRAQAMARLAAFAGLAPARDPDAPARPTFRSAVAVGGYHAALAGGLSTASVGRWKRRLTTAQVARFESIAGPALARLGYETKQDGAPARQPGLASLLRERLRPVSWFRTGRRLLPVLLAAEGWLRAPFEQRQG